MNNRDKNFTPAKMQRRMAQIEESIARYLAQLDTADWQEPSEAFTTKTNRLQREDRDAEAADAARLEASQGGDACTTPDQQISLTDPDARSMATSGRGSGVVGYNVQIAVEANHHLIVTHEVTNDGRVLPWLRVSSCARGRRFDPAAPAGSYGDCSARADRNPAGRGVCGGCALWHFRRSGP